jgi:hypothetical protein
MSSRGIPFSFSMYSRTDRISWLMLSDLDEIIEKKKRAGAYPLFLSRRIKEPT